MRPMYKEIALNPSHPGDGNRGLWYDKFCNEWNEARLGIEKASPTANTFLSLSSTGRMSPKERWMKTVTETGPIGDKAQLSEITRRLHELTSTLGGLTVELVTESPFITGLGRSHPVENGFAWHHTLGVPYLPGSSIKGLMRAWAKGEWSRPNNIPQRWFGDASSIGEIRFLDALPVEPVQLSIDMMTPHYAGWNEQNPPGDWMSPTPIPFLVVNSGARFQFCILPRKRLLSEDERRGLRSHLATALKWIGAGAKTAVGYGRFSEQPPTRSSASHQEVELKVGDIVVARLLEERTRKGGWKAEELASGQVGHILNTADVPAGKKAGDSVRLEIRSVHSGGTLTFGWPTT